TVIEANGSTSLVEVGNNYFLCAVGGSTGLTLKLGDASVVAGQLDGWGPIGAEPTAGGYEVALKKTGVDQSTVWNTDSNGDALSRPIGFVSGTSPALAALEPSFQQDLNGDGTTGLPAMMVIEAFGSTSLVQVG